MEQVVQELGVERLSRPGPVERYDGVELSEVGAERALRLGACSSGGNLRVGAAGPLPSRGPELAVGGGLRRVGESIASTALIAG